MEANVSKIPIYLLEGVLIFLYKSVFFLLEKHQLMLRLRTHEGLLWPD